jgi:DNA repair exonuclease SbcCD ATPase subunit
MINDEGRGNFDAENLGNVGKIFEYLENNFKFILIVSHIDTLKDAVNDMIEIDVGDGGSHINNMPI